jgi:hypothetical protein
MRIGPRALTQIQLRREDGGVLHIHRMEDTTGAHPELVGYWVSSGLSRAFDPGRSAWWLLFGRAPAGHHPVSRERLTRPAQPPQPGADAAGAREPRRPRWPTLSGAAEAEPPRPMSGGA